MMTAADLTFAERRAERSAGDVQAALMRAKEDGLHRQALLL